VTNIDLSTFPNERKEIVNARNALAVAIENGFRYGVDYPQGNAVAIADAINVLFKAHLETCK